MNGKPVRTVSLHERYKRGFLPRDETKEAKKNVRYLDKPTKMYVIDTTYGQEEPEDLDEGNSSLRLRADGYFG